MSLPAVGTEFLRVLRFTCIKKKIMFALVFGVSFFPSSSIDRWDTVLTLCLGDDGGLLGVQRSSAYVLGSPMWDDFQELEVGPFCQLVLFIVLPSGDRRLRLGAGSEAAVDLELRLVRGHGEGLGGVKDPLYHRHFSEPARGKRTDTWDPPSHLAFFNCCSSRWFTQSQDFLSDMRR